MHTFISRYEIPVVSLSLSFLPCTCVLFSLEKLTELAEEIVLNL